MSKDIKDYLHYYPKVSGLFGDVQYELWYIRDDECYLTRISAGGFNKWNQCAIERFKPILRPLSDMTEDEAIELIKLNTWKQYGGHPHDREYKTYKNSFGQLVVSWGEGLREKNVPVTKEAFRPNEIVYLLSKHFDIFNLIPEGLAISKTKQGI